MHTILAFSYLLLKLIAPVLAVAAHHDLNAFSPRQLQASCLPIFLEYPTPSDVKCDNGLYVMSVCHCCPSGTVGCYSFQDCMQTAEGTWGCRNTGSDCSGSSGGDSPAASSVAATNAAPSAAPSSSQVGGEGEGGTQPTTSTAAAATSPTASGSSSGSGADGRAAMMNSQWALVGLGAGLVWTL